MPTFTAQIGYRYMVTLPAKPRPTNFDANSTVENEQEDERSCVHHEHIENGNVDRLVNGVQSESSGFDEANLVLKEYRQGL